MSILTGLLQASLLVQPLADHTYLSSNVLSGGVSTYDPTTPRLALEEGGRTRYHPVIVHNTPKTGEPSVGVTTFLYERIIRLERAVRQDGLSINVGEIQGSATIEQTLWNGFKDLVTITAIDYSYVTGEVIVTAPIVTEVFNIYEERPLNILIDIAGDSFADLEITITFSNGATSVFTVTDFHIVQKGFTYFSQANWLGGMRMESQYLTSIYKASETSETRQALRPKPIRKISYEFASVGENFSTVLWGFMQGLTKRRTYLPLFQDGSVVTQDSTGTKIYCDTVNKRFYVGNTILIAIRRYDRSHRQGTSENEALYFTGVIGLVFDTYINVIASPLAEIPKNSMIYPGIFSEIATKNNTFEVFKPTGAIADVTINEVFGPTTLEADNSDYSPTLFYDDAFFTFEWNWKVPPKVGLKRDAIILKKGRYPTTIPRTGFSTVSIEAAVSVHSRAEWWELTGFLNYVKGRYRAFWVKHPLDTYRLGSYTQFDGADLEEVEVLTQGGINNMFSIQAVWIKDSNGVEYIVKVNAIRAGTGSSSAILELDPTVVTDVAEIKRAFLVRNTSDKIIEHWFTDQGVVEVNMKMVELPGAYS